MIWPIVAITAIGLFWGQIMPNVAGDGVRTWLLAKLTRSWMRSLFSVLLDRALGLYLLVVVSLIALWLPASYQLPDGLRMISAEILGSCAVLGAAAILLTPLIASKLEGHRMARWAVDALTAQKILLHSWTGPAALAVSFVVHGLWPQFEHGFPEFCQVPAPKLDRNVVGSMLDIMPAPRLIFQQWEKHGTCSGLTPNAYFETVRKVRATVKIPPEFMQLTEMLTVTPDEVEEAFVKANPGLSRDAVAVTCDSRRLSEVRVCIGRDFHFHSCPDIDEHACRREKVVMPPLRQGTAALAR